VHLVLLRRFFATVHPVRFTVDVHDPFVNICDRLSTTEGKADRAPPSHSWARIDFSALNRNPSHR
jgi:hypothetical protein